MIRALINGELVADPQERTARNGNTFALARVSVPQGDAGRIYCSVIAFDDDAVKRLLTLRKGAAVAIGGTLKATLWQPEHGDPRVQIEMVADEVASTTPKPRKPKEKAAKPLPAEDWLSA